MDGERSRNEEAVLRLREQSRELLARARNLRIARLLALAALVSTTAVRLERWREAKEAKAAASAYARHDALCAEQKVVWTATRLEAESRLIRAVADRDQLAIRRAHCEVEDVWEAASFAAARDRCRFDVPAPVGCPANAD